MSVPLPRRIYHVPIVHLEDVPWYSKPRLALPSPYETFGPCTSKISVDEDGKIVGVTIRDEICTGRHWEQSDGAEVVDLFAKNEDKCTFLFPGLIDTHIHALQYPNIGIFGSTTLLSWLEKYTFPTEEELAKDLKKASTVLSACVKRTLRNGTTTAAYYSNSSYQTTSLLLGEVLRQGQRALIGRCAMDRDGQVPEPIRDPSAEDAMATDKKMIGKIRKADDGRNLVLPVITPRFAPSCTIQCMKGLGLLAEQMSCRVQTHISETKDEMALVKKLYPDSLTYVDVYDRADLLKPNTILAHGVWLTDHELQMVKAIGCGIAHCPTSNAALGSGIAPVRKMLDLGIPVGLGTDISGGHSPSVVEVARQASMLSGVLQYQPGHEGTARLSVDELLWMATRGGAQVVSMADQIGGFEVGKEFDALLVTLEREGPVEFWQERSWEERVEKWVWTGDARCIGKVWVRGRCVVGERYRP